MSLIEAFGPIRQHGYLVKDLDKAMDFWLTTLGLGPWFGYRGVTLVNETETVGNDIHLDVGLAYSDGVQIELIHQLCDSPSPYRFFYDLEGSMIQQQIAFFCRDIERARLRAQSLGLTPAGSILTPTGQRALYYAHPAAGHIVIELLEVDNTLLEGFEYFEQESRNWDQVTNPYRLISMS
ncbi:MAG: VOC family protein [Cellvibrionaceae bacterium]